jgi:hypothetical protein
VAEGERLSVGNVKCEQLHIAQNFGPEMKSPFCLYFVLIIEVILGKR